MAKKKIFVSYDYDNDRHYKNLLLAWDTNRVFDFGFSDQSADVSIQSTNAVCNQACDFSQDKCSHLLPVPCWRKYFP